MPPLSSGGALVAQPWLRFHTPLIEPDVQISRILLSDKTSRLRPRHVVPKPTQAYEPEVPVEVREWIAPAPSSPDFVLGAQPPAQPHRCVSIERPIRLADGSYLEVVQSWFRSSEQDSAKAKWTAAGWSFAISRAGRDGGRA